MSPHQNDLEPNCAHKHTASPQAEVKEHLTTPPPHMRLTASSLQTEPNYRCSTQITDPALGIYRAVLVPVPIMATQRRLFQAILSELCLCFRILNLKHFWAPSWESESHPRKTEQSESELRVLMAGSDYKAPPPSPGSTDLNNQGGPQSSSGEVVWGAWANPEP